MKKTTNHVVFWQPSISPHQTPLLNQFARDWHGQIHLVTDKYTDSKRSEVSGWDTQLPTEVTIHSSGKNAPTAAIHIVSGMHGTTQWKKNRRRVLNDRCARIWIMSESLQTNDGLFKTVLRFTRQGAARLRFMNRISGYLAIGEVAQAQARMLKISKNKIFPFCYVTASQESTSIRPISNFERPNLLFVGRISKAKGVDVLLKMDMHDELQIQLIGAQTDQDIEIPSTVQLLGVIPNNEISSYIRNADVLVLPSRYDGWGAVINEALTVGTPVVCTAACGASTLLQTAKPYKGEVVSTLSPSTLQEAIKNILIAQPSREGLISWAQDKISEKAISLYLIDILNGKNPAAPWSTI